jgi:hypothetical protein
MTLRIRFPQGKRVRRHRAEGREMALAFSSLLTPVCVMAYVLAFWRLAADVGLAGDSGLQGPLAHWQVWFAVAAGIQMGGRLLARRLEPERSGHQVSNRIQ